MRWLIALTLLFSGCLGIGGDAEEIRLEAPEWQTGKTWRETHVTEWRADHSEGDGVGAFYGETMSEDLTVTVWNLTSFPDEAVVQVAREHDNHTWSDAFVMPIGGGGWQPLRVTHLYGDNYDLTKLDTNEDPTPALRFPLVSGDKWTEVREQGFLEETFKNRVVGAATREVDGRDVPGLLIETEYTAEYSDEGRQAMAEQIDGWGATVESLELRHDYTIQSLYSGEYGLRVWTELEGSIAQSSVIAWDGEVEESSVDVSIHQVRTLTDHTPGDGEPRSYGDLVVAEVEGGALYIDRTGPWSLAAEDASTVVYTIRNYGQPMPANTTYHWEVMDFDGTSIATAVGEVFEHEWDTAGAYGVRVVARSGEAVMDWDYTVERVDAHVYSIVDCESLTDNSLSLGGCEGFALDVNPGTGMLDLAIQVQSQAPQASFVDVTVRDGNGEERPIDNFIPGDYRAWYEINSDRDLGTWTVEVEIDRGLDAEITYDARLYTYGYPAPSAWSAEP